MPQRSPIGRPGREDNADASTPPEITDETRWLTAEERAAWLAAASIIFTLPAALDSRIQQQSDLTFFEYMVLAALSERDDRTMRMSDIAGGLSSSLSRLSHVVTRLEKQELLCRSRIPGAGRRTNVTLTDHGYERVVAAAPDHVESVRRFFIDALTPDDVIAMQRIGDTVARGINPIHPVIHGAES